MKIKVYFETPNHNYAEVIAQFSDQEAYDRCAETLEQLADNRNMIVTESFE